MTVEFTRARAKGFMRWVIVLTLFGGFIYESNKVDSLQQQLDTAKTLLESKRTDWIECSREYADLAQTCKK